MLWLQRGFEGFPSHTLLPLPPGCPPPPILVDKVTTATTTERLSRRFHIARERESADLAAGGNISEGEADVAEVLVVLLVGLHVLPLVDDLGQVHLAQRQLDLNNNNNTRFHCKEISIYVFPEKELLAVSVPISTFLCL